MLNGKILKSVHLAQKGDLLETLLRDGTLESTVEKAVEKGK
jgi:hypothetical protein